MQFSHSVLLAVSLFGTVPALRPGDQETTIDQPSDVLPDSVAHSLAPDLKERLLGSVDEPIYLLVNPHLGDIADPRGLRALLHPAGAPPFKDVATLEFLCRPRWDEKPLVYDLLKDVSGEFLGQFFGDDVQRGDSLEKLIAKGALLSNRIVLATVDVTCQGGRGPLAGLEVDVRFRIYRVDYDESKYPYPVRAIELLFSDQATGRSPLPLSVTEDSVRTAFRKATVDAFRNRIALSLFGSARMVDQNWLGEPRGDLFGPPLSARPRIAIEEVQ